MNALFFVLLTLFLIIFQTVLLPSFSFFINCFDLMIINVLFISLISKRRSTIFMIILIGLVMDSIAGVPFTYHLFSYLWIYIIVHLVRQFFFQKSIIFVLIMSVVSVAIQHGLLLLSILVNQKDILIQTIDFGLLFKQLVLGLIIIPPCIWFLDISWKQWKLFVRHLEDQWLKAREDTID